MTLNAGQKLWEQAKKLIPGGNMLLSKRPEMFLPDYWPAYYSKCKDCYVWDLEDKKYIDVSIMGIGTNILGYANPEVDMAVQSVVTSGNMSTLNCPEEVRLAERLVGMHPWADMVRLARSGGEANAISIRIARAACGKDNVAICGYHGWHDWYLATNLADAEGLDGHLLPGLNPSGVPQKLRGSIFPFKYNEFETLKRLVSDHDIGVIKMEVMRSAPPKPGFLEQVRSLCDEKNIILIFDECTSGFRQAFGGIHKIFGVEPDIATFGKALGNGYAISAVVGKRSVMDSAQSTFISSTFWTERIGPAAALKTLEVMERDKSWEVITSIGNKIRNRWLEIGKRTNLPIEVSGLPAILSYSFDLPKSQIIRTAVTQLMLKNGFLSTPLVYVSTAHTEQVLDLYFENLELVFGTIKEAINQDNLENILDGPVCHSGFSRLN